MLDGKNKCQLYGGIVITIAFSTAVKHRIFFQVYNLVKYKSRLYEVTPYNIWCAVFN